MQYIEEEEIITRKVSVIRFLVICLLISTPLPVALSEDSALVNFKMLSLSTAMKLAKETLKNCQSKGFQVAVAIVDRSGVTQVILRDRFAGPHTVEVHECLSSPRGTSKFEDYP